MKGKRLLRKLLESNIIRYALLMGAQNMPNKEEYALNMERWYRSNYVAAMDAIITSDEEECAGGMGQRSK